MTPESKNKLEAIRKDVDACLVKSFQIEAGLKAIAQISRDGFSKCERLSTPEVRPHNIASLAELLARQIEQSQGLLSSIDHELDKASRVTDGQGGH